MKPIDHTNADNPNLSMFSHVKGMTSAATSCTAPAFLAKWRSLVKSCRGNLRIEEAFLATLMPLTIGRMRCRTLRSSALALATIVLLFPYNAFALSVNGTPTANFDGANLLLDFTVQLGLGPDSILPAGSLVSVQFQDSSGAPLGNPFNAKVGVNGMLTIGRAQFPPGASSLGNQVVFHDITGNSQPVKWYDSRWSITLNPNVSPAIKIDPFGLPGVTSPQSWFIDQSDVKVNGVPLVATNFDVTYSDLGGGVFDASIRGANSFLKIGDNTYIDLPDGLSFGTLDYLFNNGITANGLVDFSAIGLSGAFTWSASTNYASANATTTNSFEAPAISVVPEPSSWMLLGSGAFGLGGFLRKRLLTRT